MSTTTKVIQTSRGHAQRYHVKDGETPAANKSRVAAAAATPQQASSAQRIERSPAEARAFAQEVKARYPGITLDLSGSEHSEYVTLGLISIPKEMRGQGIAKKVMQELVDEADANGWTLDCTPSSDFGSSKARLVEFYRGFGFVPNSGRNKDFGTRETMLRLPAE